MTSQDRKEQQDELQALLDTWGAEPARWPPKVRLRIAELSGPAAGPIIAEARALDRLLDMVDEKPAGQTPARTGALADRIMAAANADGSPASGPVRKAEIIELPRRPVVPAQAPAVRHGSSGLPAIAGRRWHTAGLLAASLLVGIFVGGTLNIAPVVQEFAEAVGLSQNVDGSVLGDDLDDEETL